MSRIVVDVNFGIADYCDRYGDGDVAVEACGYGYVDVAAYVYGTVDVDGVVGLGADVVF